MPALSAIAQKGSAAAGTDKIVLVEGVYVPASEIAALATATTASYDNTTSGLTATDVQAAIDEIAGGGGSVAGSDKQVQYNNSGAFGAEAGFEYDATTNTLTVSNIDTAGLLNTAASAIGGAGLNVPHGVAPTTPVDGDVWTTSAGMYARINGVTVGPLGAGGGGGLTNWTDGLNTSAPNATIPVATFTATNAAANVDAAFLPKGTGSILGDVPDGTSAGGNKRGTNSVDLQQIRATAGQVASGTESFIGAGRNNTASANNSAVIGGQSNIASGTNSLAHGSTSTASATGAVALGTTSTASGADSFAFAGGTANAAGSYAIGAGATANAVVNAFAEGSRSGYPRSRYTLVGSSTTATPFTLTTDAGAAAATNQVYFGNFNNRSGIYRGMVVARQTGNSGSKKSWEFIAHLDRDNGTLALVAAVTPTVVADSGVGWSIAVTADNTLKTLTVTVTGAAATTIRWACFVDGQECQGT